MIYQLLDSPPSLSLLPNSLAYCITSQCHPTVITRPSFFYFIPPSALQLSIPYLPYFPSSHSLLHQLLFSLLVHSLSPSSSSVVSLWSSILEVSRMLSQISPFVWCTVAVHRLWATFPNRRSCAGGDWMAGSSSLTLLDSHHSIPRSVVSLFPSHHSSSSYRPFLGRN